MKASHTKLFRSFITAALLCVGVCLAFASVLDVGAKGAALSHRPGGTSCEAISIFLT
jgi:hypothetical protein